MLLRALNFGLFYVGWFGCVLTAAQGQQWAGPLIIAGIIIIHFYLVADHSGELLTLLAAAIMGAVFDSVVMHAGALSFPHGSPLPGLVPPWMISLWIAFGMTFNSSMRWLHRRAMIAAPLGALSGPLAYWAGARLGALALGPDLVFSALVIAVEWLIALPLLLWITQRVNHIFVPVFKKPEPESGPAG